MWASGERNKIFICSLFVIFCGCRWMIIIMVNVDIGVAGCSVVMG